MESEVRAKFVLEALKGWTSMTELWARYGIRRRVGYTCGRLCYGLTILDAYSRYLVDCHVRHSDGRDANGL